MFVCAFILGNPLSERSPIERQKTGSLFQIPSIYVVSGSGTVLDTLRFQDPRCKCEKHTCASRARADKHERRTAKIAIEINLPPSN